MAQRLTHEQLLLLSILIYAIHRTHFGRKRLTVGGIAAEIRKEVAREILPKNPIQTSQQEWLAICDFILRDPLLSSYRIAHLAYNGGMMALVAKERWLLARDVNIVFRGTAQMADWDDNAVSAYEADSPLQLRAQRYIRRLPYRRFTITGHSKGGNYAQYLTVRNRRAERAVAFDAEGFSPEFVGKYSGKISRAVNRIVNISAAGDPVHRMLIPLHGIRHIFIKTPRLLNPFLYHKPTVLLDQNGKLRPRANRELSLPKTFAAFGERAVEGLTLAQRKKLAHSLTEVVKSQFARKTGDGVRQKPQQKSRNSRPTRPSPPEAT